MQDKCHAVILGIPVYISARRQAKGIHRFSNHLKLHRAAHVPGDPPVLGILIQNSKLDFA